MYKFYGAFPLEIFSSINAPNFNVTEFLINLLETVKHNKYIGHRLQGVLYKIQ